jgi:hypothetical protein
MDSIHWLADNWKGNLRISTPNTDLDAEQWCDDEAGIAQMKTIEFEAAVGPGGQIPIPPDIARELPPGEPLHIVLQWSESGEGDAAWRAAGNQRFEATYAPEDHVYEELMQD